MTRPPASRRTVAPSPPERDRGTTLTELLISMVVLGVFLGIFATTLIALTTSMRRQANLEVAQGGTRQAFLILDKQIRYARAVSTPATLSDGQWIEWQDVDPTIPTSASPTQSRCFQWRASTTTGLQYRSWVVPASGTVSTPPWVTVASGLVVSGQAVFTTSASGLAAAPFLLPASMSTYGLAQVRVGVALSLSVGSPPALAAASTLFSALDSTTTATTSVCTEVPRA